VPPPKIGKSVPSNIRRSSKFHKTFWLNNLWVLGSSGNSSSGVGSGKGGADYK